MNLLKQPCNRILVRIILDDNVEILLDIVGELVEAAL